MLTVRQMQERAVKTKAVFAQKIPEATSWINKVEIFLISQRQRMVQRAAAFEKIQGPVKEDFPDTVGEVIVGKKGYGILVYCAAVQSAFHFDYMLWHELGHILSNINNLEIESEAVLECLQGKQTALAIGCSVWMEFIADVIALYVTGGRPVLELIDQLEDELGYKVSQMVQERFIIPGLLGHYCAYLLMNPTLKMLRKDGKYFPTGLEYARKGQAPYITNIVKLLSAQLEEKPFWTISREKMESIGEAMDALWDAS